MWSIYSFAACQTRPRGGYEQQAGTVTDTMQRREDGPETGTRFDCGAPRTTYMPRPATPGGYPPPALVPSTPPRPLPLVPPLQSYDGRTTLLQAVCRVWRRPSKSASRLMLTRRVQDCWSVARGAFPRLLTLFLAGLTCISSVKPVLLHGMHGRRVLAYRDETHVMHRRGHPPDAAYTSRIPIFAARKHAAALSTSHSFTAVPV